MAVEEQEKPTSVTGGDDPISGCAKGGCVLFAGLLMVLITYFLAGELPDTKTVLGGIVEGLFILLFWMGGTAGVLWLFMRLASLFSRRKNN